MSGKRMAFLSTALALLVMAQPAFGEAARPTPSLVDGSAPSGLPPFGAVERGEGRVAAVFISGGAAPGPCLDAAAAAVAARFRTISLSLDPGIVASLGGQAGTAAELARLLGDAGVERACIVGCCSAAALVDSVALAGRAISSAVFFGQPAMGGKLAIPAVYLAPTAGPEELAGQVFELLGPLAAPRSAPRGPLFGRSAPAVPN